MQAQQTLSSVNELTARKALEQVCSGACPQDVGQYYSPNFVDHVNGAHFQGFAGIERSVAAYRNLIVDLTIKVQDQISAGDRVVCRFVVAGVVRGRRVEFDGITVSRLENGLIVEDWSVADTLSIFRQIGAWRSLLILLRG